MSSCRLKIISKIVSYSKVTKITGSMSGLDENLNYLLGRLSLVTQEFNQIKTGLGQALDNIRSTFQVVQNKMEGQYPHVRLL